MTSSRKATSSGIEKLEKMVEVATGERFDPLWWHNAAPRDKWGLDPGLVTVASALAERKVVIGGTGALRETSRLKSERHLLAAVTAPDKLVGRLELLELLHRIVPDCREPLVRTQLLPLLGPADTVQEARWDELVGLADELATTLPASRLPLGRLLGLSVVDGTEADTSGLERSISGFPDERVAAIGISLFPKGSAEYRWQRAYGAKFVRRLVNSNGLAKALVVNSGWNAKTTVKWSDVKRAWDQAEKLAAASALRIGGPLSVGATELGRIRITDETLERYEVTLELAYLNEVIACGADPSLRARRSAWRHVYEGSTDVRDMLRIAAKTCGLWVAGPLRIPRAPSETRFLGVEDDAEQLDPAIHAEVAAFGCEVLSASDSDNHHRAWDALWIYGLRPRETALLWPWGRAPLGAAHAVYVSAVAGKTGRREAIEAASATSNLGIGRGWLFERPTRVGEEAWCRLAALRAANACREVRKRWVEDGREELPGRTAYFVRHAVADQLRLGLGNRPDALAVALGHLSGVTDAPYTMLSASEHQGVITDAWHEWLLAGERAR